MKAVLLAGLAAVLLLASLGSAADKPEVNAVVQGNDAFAFDLYTHLAGKPGNLFCSPYSLSTALAMTYAGARGETAAEMARTLHFPRQQQDLHPAFARLIQELDGKGQARPFELHIANALWGQKGYPFLPEFLALTKANYGSGLREVDFVNATNEARRTINQWVEQETKQKIKDLIPPDVLNRMTRLVLTNAIYFKAPWQSPFSEHATKPEDFRVTAGQNVTVPMMHQAERFNYLDGGTFQLLEMPYRGGAQSMLVLLPKKVDGLAEFEKTLTVKSLEAWLSKSRPQQVKVAFPRFKITQEFELNKTLAAMGMPQAFSERADFSGMDGRRDLAISNVLHKAFVDVNEKGTEAAAATGVVVGRLSAPTAMPQEFRADHPFVFLIRDVRTGSILFLGRVANPKT